MKILDANHKFILVFANPSTLFLIDSLTLQILHKKQYPPKTPINSASLQYGTGIAAISIANKVHFYDFFYQRQIYALDTYKPILQVSLRKNLLFVVSQDRILIYNVDKKQNQSYIQTINGKLVFFDQNYTNLSIFYPEDNSVLVSKPIWSLKGWKCTNGVKYEAGCYFDQGSKVVLSLFNTLSFYEEGEMIKVYGFDYKIVDVKSSENPKMAYVLLQNNEIIGQNLSEQLRYEFEEVKQNGLTSIGLEEQPRKQRSQCCFWISNGEIYVWKREQNGGVKVLKADANKGIKNVYVQTRSKQYIMLKEVQEVQEVNKEQIKGEASQ